MRTHLLQLLLLARRDVHRGAVLHVRRGEHRPDARAPARHHRCPPPRRQMPQPANTNTRKARAPTLPLTSKREFTERSVPRSVPRAAYSRGRRTFTVGHGVEERLGSLRFTPHAGRGHYVLSRGAQVQGVVARRNTERSRSPHAAGIIQMRGAFAQLERVCRETVMSCRLGCLEVCLNDDLETQGVLMFVRHV